MFPALFIFLCPAHAAFTSDIFIRDSDLIEEVRTDYRELRSLALRIFEICPPGDCLYIGIGQSPTPLLALLESVTGEPTVNIPLSDVRQLHDIADPDIRTAAIKGMRRHLAHHLSPEDNRKMLVTDFAATTAASLTFSFSAIKSFLPKNQVYGFGMTAFGPSDRNTSHLVLRQRQIALKPWLKHSGLFRRTISLYVTTRKFRRSGRSSIAAAT